MINSDMKTVLLAWRFTARHKVLNSSFGYQYLRARRNYGGYRLESDTAMVVEGFPRSANTYVWYALRRVLEPTHKVSGHTHAASNVVAAAKRGVPTMLLVRHPDDAVASLVQQSKAANVRRAFNAYALFYDKCLPVLDQVFLASFTEVTTGLPDVVDTFLTHNDLDWPRYRGTPEDEAAVREAIDQADSQRWGGNVREAGVARPSKFRRPAAAVLSNLTPKEERARERAMSSYRTLLTVSKRTLQK